MDIFDKILSETPREIDVFVDKSIQIADRVNDLLIKAEMTPGKFAKEFEVSEEEVYNWLRGTFDFSIELIAKLEVFFDDSIINVYQIDEEQISHDKKASSEYKESKKEIEASQNKDIEQGLFIEASNLSEPDVEESADDSIELQAA